MIRRMALRLLLVMLGLFFAHAALAESFKLLNGSTLDGEPVSFNGEGVVVKRSDKTFAPRVGWTKFSQSALKKLMKYEAAQPFAEPLIEEDVELEPIPTTPKVTLKSVPRLTRPSAETGLGAVFSSPLSLAVLLLIYAANIYAGWEIGRYRNYHPAMVGGIAAIAPIIGPVIFLCLPTYFEEVIEEEEPPPPPEPIAVPAKGPMFRDAEEEAEAAAAPLAPGGPPPPTIYRRPQTTFNRRFFETKLASFLKVVPNEAEKDMVLCVVSARGNYVATRISRIQANELSFLVKKGEASTDVEIPFSEITEVQVRHKDANT